MLTWALITANSMPSWGFFVILSWMPLYFNWVYHVDLRRAAWFRAAPWSVMAFVGYLPGMYSDYLIQRGTTITLNRKITQEIAPEYSGVLHGISNTDGTTAAIMGTGGAGFFVELVGSFQGFLLLTSLLYVLAATIWNLFSSGERINFDEADSEEGMLQQPS